jgi:chromosome segregation protein
MKLRRRVDCAWRLLYTINRSAHDFTVVSAMRLTRIRLAGFKSFVDPTSVQFPSNLTGVVGPNGCGKSNVIDAVRWVMGELSARHLRGESMADVIFNGSAGRKPVGTASVELLFDNTDGKIGGAYAGYSEVSLKRAVSRDGSSAYFINGARCRRKDITQLFLGTGLGSRSYAIIEQGMISRVIEAKTEDMRAFLEEAAGISRYKERRRETESRIADTRENLERLQDVRDEVDRQIRHLQRQAAVARRYQSFKEDERRLVAEVLALKLRDLDGGTERHDGAVRQSELAMQSALADQRSAEAGIEKQRAFHAEQSDALAAVQGHYYEIGTEITRTEQSIRHTRELRERQRGDLAKSRSTLAELALQIERDETDLASLRAELGTLAPALEAAQAAEQAATLTLAEAERSLSTWQQGWEAFNRELGAAHQTTQVERARIEQLENQLRQLVGRADRLTLERETLAAQDVAGALTEIAAREAEARARSDELVRAHAAALDRVQTLRTAQLALEQRLEAGRQVRERLRAEQLSVEAVQKAALGRAPGKASDWLARNGLGDRSRLAETLTVATGWEHAVETVLGDDLEAVCVTTLEEIVGRLDGLEEGRISMLESASTGSVAEPARLGSSLAAQVQGPAGVLRALARVRTAGTLAEALRARHELAAEESVVTPSGEWLGRDWLRVRRGNDHHAGVIEREHRLKALRVEVDEAAANVAGLESGLAAERTALAEAESVRDAIQADIQAASRRHADLLGQLEATRARSQESSRRRARIDAESEEVTRESASTAEAIARARGALEAGLLALASLDARLPGLEEEREERRAALTEARMRSEGARLAARDLLVRAESRRSRETSMQVTLERIMVQRTELAARAAELERELGAGDGPILELEATLTEALSRRVEVEAALASARAVLEDSDSELRALEERRLAAERRVASARESMAAARLAAQETRVRREALAEQFLATRLDLAEVTAALAADADAARSELALNAVREDIERLGQVNLAAIDELREQNERKEYLDRQFQDLTDALETLEGAMQKIDKETRARFEDTFNRVNAGLQEKFPRLFGGGNAYLELVGENILNAGVAVMARPPGKRNSTISQLSGGEKALTAVALVFSIFDLNPAPFCLLDEVDAPLDEHNVGRFCDIVREMSGRVQFIFITHNKATMELASQLIGVTMHEPGVSRLVAVDVDEAVRLAAV